MDWLDHTEVRQALLSAGSFVLAGLVLFLGLGAMGGVQSPEPLGGGGVSFAKLAPPILSAIGLLAGIAAAYFGLRETGNYRLACVVGLVTNITLLGVLVVLIGIDVWRTWYLHL